MVIDVSTWLDETTWPKVEITEDVTTVTDTAGLVGTGIVKPSGVRINGAEVLVPIDTTIEVRHRESDLLEVRLSLFVAADDLTIGIRSDEASDQELVSEVRQDLINQLLAGRVIDINAHDGIQLHED